MKTREKEYVLIPLSRGVFTAVSPRDAKRIGKYNWQPHFSPRGRIDSVSGRVQNVLVQLARFILHLPKGSGTEVDHRNGCALDNRRTNLRVCTKAENRKNTMRHYRGKSPANAFRGVHRNHANSGGKSSWVAMIPIDCRYHYLGSFKTEEAAARAWDSAARRVYGQYARLNFPKVNERPPTPPQEVINQIPKPADKRNRRGNA